jgi:HNH endonuclease
MLNKHLDPSHANHRAQSSFWRLLTGFWTEDRVAEWRNKIFPNPDHPDTGVDVCFNLISLSPSAHWYWNKGLFALKPLEISDDKKLSVQFVWQPQYSHGSKDLVDLLEEPLSSKDLRFAKKDGIECHLTYPYDNVSARYIQSGDIFTFTTDDPETRPLPSWELLDMRWVLQRLTAMSGAAGTADVDLYDNDDMDSGFYAHSGR